MTRLCFAIATSNGPFSRIFNSSNARPGKFYSVRVTARV